MARAIPQPAFDLLKGLYDHSHGRADQIVCARRLARRLGMTQDIARAALDYLIPAGWVLDTGEKVSLPHVVITVAGIRVVENLMSAGPRHHPVAATDRASADRDLPAQQDRDDRPHVLLVEDEFLVRVVVADALRELGFAVEDVSSAAGALDRLQLTQKRIAVAVVDIGLPDLNGAMLVRQIRAGRPDLPIVVASGRPPSLMRRQVDADAQIRFLHKPYDTEDMRLAFDSLGVTTVSPPVSHAR